MNDPHVEWLKYRLETNERTMRFNAAPPLVREYDAFRCRLEDGILTVELKEHHASVASAKQRIEPFLEDWATHAALTVSCARFRFHLQDEHVIDRSPSPVDPDQVTVTAVSTLSPITQSATVTVLPRTFNQYPAPPTRFRASPDVETMWLRYQRHVRDKEGYQSVGYFCLSLLQWTAGGRFRAAQDYRIERAVLDKLGELTSERGTPADARKLDDRSTLLPLTDDEKRWIRATVRKLIQRKAEYDYDPNTADSLPTITFADLPQL